MCPGFFDNLRQVDDSRKTAINRELKRFSIDITALQETRLPSTSSLRKHDYTLILLIRNQRSQGFMALDLQ